MNKRFLIPSVLALFSLFSCAGGSSTSETSSSPASSSEEDAILDLIDSLKGRSHKAHVEQNVFVHQEDEFAIDLYAGYFADYVYSYSSSGERAFRRSSINKYADLVKGTHEMMEMSEYPAPTRTYFRDEESGAVIVEYLGVDNEVTSVYQSDYDANTGTYTPVLFDEEFRNPFDYIMPRDLEKLNDDGDYALALDKARFTLNCYDAMTSDFVTSGTIHSSNGTITSITYTMKLDGGEGFSYSREIDFVVTFSDYGDVSTISHVTPRQNDNPALQAAFDSIKNVDSYHYYKEYTNLRGTSKDHIDGYFTQDASFYHHIKSEADKEAMYETGDDYDYCAVKNSVDEKYYGFEYSYGYDSYRWHDIALSGSALYSIDTFDGLGPRFFELSAAIFKLKEGTNNVYVLDNPDVEDEIASYFDFQFLGVNSLVLETRTDGMEITLDNDGSFTVKTAYSYVDYGEDVIQPIVFHLDASSINHTVMPSFFDCPSAEGLEDFGQ